VSSVWTRCLQRVPKAVKWPIRCPLMFWKCYSYHAVTSVIVSGGGRNATANDLKPKWNAQIQQSRMDANMGLTINSFRPLFPDKVLSDTSLTFSKIIDNHNLQEQARLFLLDGTIIIPLTGSILQFLETDATCCTLYWHSLHSITSPSRSMVAVTWSLALNLMLRS